MRSRPVGEGVAEVEKLAGEGNKEIVITGVLVGAYGQESDFAARNEAYGERQNEARNGGRNGLHGETLINTTRAQHWGMDTTYARPDLADLLLQLAQGEGIERVRPSSNRPTQGTERHRDA